MDHIPLRFQSFKLHLTIPENRQASLPQKLTLIYLPRINETLLKINGVEISPNKKAIITLRRIRSTEVADESEVVFASMDRICVEDDLNFEVRIRGKKSFQGIIRRGARWGLECETIDHMVWAKVSVVTDGGFLMREKVRLGRNRFCPKLPTILEEDEEEDATKKIGEVGGLNYVEEKEKNGDDGESKKGASWLLNVGIFVACLGVGLFASRASFKRLVGLNLL